LDKQAFPRDKVCGGWITPAVLEELEIHSGEYAQGRILQPITGFRTSCMGAAEVETDYGRPISYGILRYEWDEYLLRRSGARLLLGTPLKRLERSGDEWVVNGQFRTRLVVGAGGHFCPVARLLGARAAQETVVVAQETEFEMNATQQSACSIRPEIPELYFCPDLRGYGWCFRKRNVLNVGLGRLDKRCFPQHLARFLSFLTAKEKVAFDLHPCFPGHAYLLNDHTRPNIACDGVLLIGDAAGLAYSQSGEGIRPAIESGLLAASVIAAAGPNYSPERLETYRALLARRLGKSGRDWATRVGQRLPRRLVSSVARLLLATPLFSRHVLLDRWFLHRDEPALDLPGAVPRIRFEDEKHTRSSLAHLRR